MILVPGVFLSIGLYFLVGYVLVPMISIHASASTYYPIIDPISVSPILSVLKNDSSKFTFNELDYEFREKREENFIIRDDAPDRFYITIPKLDIYDAIVETNSDTLDPIDMLGHYKGTCLPDEDCNIFIYGHSTHKWVKNKYESGDYSSVFSNLDELEYGNEIIINFNNKEYKYIVDSSIIKKPEDVDPLAQPYPKTLADHKSSIELFTCTPAGSTKYRLTVVAKQVN
jgi:LPXTG-site transpeptidase (sortase) family protein